MRYNDLKPEEKKAIDEVMRVFKIQELVHHDKIRMGEAIKTYVDACGQNGSAFVHLAYEKATEENPLARINPPLWLLCSFLATLCRTALRKFGYNNIQDPWEFIELAQDAIQVADSRARA